MDCQYPHGTIRQRRHWSVAALMALCVLPLAAQDLPHLLICTTMPAGLKAERVPVLTTVNLTEVRATVGGTAFSANGLVHAEEGLAAVPAQFDALSDTLGRVCLLLPTQPAGPRRVKLYLTPLAPTVTSPVTAEQNGATITVNTGSVTLTFDPAKGGGLPSKIVFTQGGKSWDGMVFNDRVYQPALQGFRLGDDKEPQVRLTANGPLYTEVQVAARYLAGDRPTPANTAATYTFSFLAGSPTFRVSGAIQQGQAFDWQELHFLELYFKDKAFPEYAASDAARQSFKEVGKGDYHPRWGALIDGQNAIGFLTTALIYDGDKDYGRYLHGPWLSWGDTQAQLTVDVWAGTAADPVAAISAAADSGVRLLAGTALTPGLVAGLDRLRQAGARQAWFAALLERAVVQGEVGLAAAGKAVPSLLARKAIRDHWLRLGSAALYLLGNDQMGLAISTGTPGSASLVSFFDLQRRRELLAAPCDLFAIDLGDGAKRKARLSSSSGWQTPITTSPAPDAKSVVLSYAGATTDPALQGLAASLKVRLEGNLSYWSIRVANESRQWSLDTVTLPSLKVAPLGGEAADDVLLFPNGYGRGYPLSSGAGLSGYYPSGWCVMQWTGICDDTSGIYVAQHDPTAGTKYLYSSCGVEGAYSTLRIVVPAENASVAGNPYTTAGEVVVGITGGGWWPQAQIYQSWLEKNAPWWPEPGSYSRSDTPEWLGSIQAWAQTGAGWAKDTVGPVQAFAEALGVPTALHWYCWHVIPFDNQYPHYFPAKEGFRQGVADLQRAGVRVMPYINGRLWDKNTDDFRAEAHTYASKRPDGEPYVENYGTSPADLVPMCASQPFWQNKITEIVLKLVGEEGVDGVYIDQVAAAGPALCYDPTHGHPLAGGHWWVDGYGKMLGPLQERIAKVSPDKFLTTECNAEPYTPYFDAFLMCNSNSDYELPLFPAVYGGKILTFGTYVGDADSTNLTLLALRQGKLFAFGSQLWWGDPNVTSKPEATAWLRDLARLRQQVNAFFVHGRMAAPPTFTERIALVPSEWKLWGQGTTIHTPEVWATTWRLENGQLLMPLVNLPLTARTLTLRFDPVAYGLKPKAKVTVERLGAAGVVETVRQRGTFELPVRLGPAEATALRITVQ
jgi:hypothetical protein